MEKTAPVPSTPQPLSSSYGSWESALRETEIGEFILKYKKAILGIFLVLIVTILAMVAVSYRNKENNKKWSEQIYSFKTDVFKNYSDKKTESSKLKEQFEKMMDGMKGEQISLLPLIEVVDELYKNKESAMALDFLSRYGTDSLKKDPVSLYLVNSRMATLLEESGEVDQAIVYLERLLSSPVKIMESKTVLDLGRLYLKKGDKEKAQAQFQFVIDNTTQQDLVKLARLYKGQGK